MELSLEPKHYFPLLLTQLAQEHSNPKPQQIKNLMTIKPCVKLNDTHNWTAI